MNHLDCEGRGFKVKVATRSDVKSFGTPYLLNGLKDFDQIVQ